MSLILLASAMSIEAKNQKNLKPSLLAQKGRPGVEDTADDDNKVSKIVDDQSEDSNTESADSDAEVDSDADTTTEEEDSADEDDDESNDVQFDSFAFAPVGTPYEPEGVTTQENNHQEFTQKQESRDMNYFDHEKGELSYKGNLNFAIVTSFEEDKEGTGKVWVLNDDPQDTFVLIGGLEQPVNSCFDSENVLLYVCDVASDDKKGFIYQYEIDWYPGFEEERCTKRHMGGYRYEKDCTWHLVKDKFKLKERSYTLVYEGSPPTDCTVDGYGNLYFPTADNHIYSISYSNLYQRKQNDVLELLDETAVAGCTGIDIRKNGELWWSNSEATELFGTLASLTWEGEDSLSQKKVDVQLDAGSAIGLALQKNDIYYISDNVLYGYNPQKEEITKMASNIEDGKSIAYGGRQIWITDFEKGMVYRCYETLEDSVMIGYDNLDNAHGIHLVNADVNRHDSNWSFGGYITVALTLLFL